ncbi:hypothetical protein ACEWY4_001722 [Coilia grayii]|uniref:Uncharacterized protein n=1 Tax=Coilia grayii TaxID=363190 RepID=A0ABD1KTQ6_9TELE
MAGILSSQTCCRVFSKQEKRANKDGLATTGYSNWKRANKDGLATTGYSKWKRANKDGLATTGYSNWKRANKDGLATTGYSNWKRANKDGLATTGYSNWKRANKDGLATTGYSKWKRANKDGLATTGYSKWKRANKDGLATTGYSNWKRALDSFREHEKTALHRASMMAWMRYKATKVHGDVTEQIVAASAAEITGRREYLRRIVMLFLAKQGIAFRGHSEGEDSTNQGNFLECMKLLSKFDPFLQQYSAPANATYLSPSSQNDFIQCSSSQITSRIREEEFLESHGVEGVKVVAQSYDGAAVMSGSVQGVQSRFRKNHPEAIYVHCYAHDLNLVLCHTCKAIPEASSFFEMLESLGSPLTWPRQSSLLCVQSLGKLASHYNIQLVPEEVLVAKSFLSRKDPESIPDILSVFKLLDSKMFPSLRAILQLALTVPVSSCSCERSFSALRRLHTWLRSTMGQSRLNELAVLSIERELVQDINEDGIIDEFARLKSRRHTLILPPTAK